MKKNKNKLVTPVLKWVGGKRQLLDVLTGFRH
jgi:site-specific DNA-adenine methylase